jgi:hypothetical protein
MESFYSFMQHGMHVQCTKKCTVYSHAKNVFFYVFCQKFCCICMMIVGILDHSVIKRDI